MKIASCLSYLYLCQVPTAAHSGNSDTTTADTRSFCQCMRGFSTTLKEMNWLAVAAGSNASDVGIRLPKGVGDRLTAHFIIGSN